MKFANRFPKPSEPAPKPKYRLGLNQHDPSKIKLHLRDYLSPGKLPTPPQVFGNSHLIHPNWGMDLNQVLGDCAIAGSIHEVRLLNACRGVTVPFTDYTAVQNYSAITGYRPGPELTIDNDQVVAINQDAPQNPTDQGTDIAQLYRFRQETGIVDAAGNHHKVGAFVGLTPGDFEELVIALYLFEVVGIGIQAPSYIDNQFAAGGPWTVESGTPDIVGGHYIPAVSRHGDTVYIVTWGGRIAMTADFYSTFSDVAVASITTEDLVKGKTLEGFDLAALQADLAALKTGPVA